jgi:diguanylate cyclase (GGDEF)-like protein
MAGHLVDIQSCEPQELMSNLIDSFAHLRVSGGTITHVSTAVWQELDCEQRDLPDRLSQLGTRLDDTTFDELCAGVAPLRLRLGHDLNDRPVRLRRLDFESDDPDEIVLEVRSLAAEFRLESLLRRSGLAHMLLSPTIELEWSMASNDMNAVLPGDNPMSWVELMDADDMQTLGKAIFKVGSDPNLRRTVSHRLNADRTYTIIDHVESALHDPDLRAVLVRSHFEDQRGPSDTVGALAPFAGITVSDHMPIGVVVASHAGKVLHRNAVAAELVGARVGQLVMPDGGEPWMMSRLSAEQSADYQSVFAAASAGQPAHCTINSPFDATSWLRLSISPAAASTVVLTIEDTTDLAEAERALRASTRLLEALDSHSEDLVIVFDARGRSRYVNSSTRSQLGDGVSVDHIDDLARLVNDVDQAAVADLVKRVTSDPSGSGEIDFRVDRGLRDPDTTGRWHHATMTNLINDPDVQGIVLTMRDIHERHLAERELHYKATHDALTTLPDRAALQTRLEAALQQGEEANSRTALLFCDIDNFKLINDRAGHHVGDLVLTEVADRLRSALRSSDFVGRFGGDEFVVVAPLVTDEAHAMELAERVFTAVTGTLRCDDVDVEVNMSMGVALTDTECTTASSLLNRADMAMYKAKEQGRGRFVLSLPPAADDEGATAQLRVDVGSAIADGQLELHYQPMVPLRSGLSKGHESLARWEHPVQGMVTAKRLFDIAEAAGLSAELGTELLRLAHADERPWFAEDDGGFISINVSASQLGHPDAATQFVERMGERGLDPSQLVIELTEASFAQGLILQDNLDVLRNAGIRIFLDNFGVGYSSVSYLHQFPVDGIKIHASVVSPVVDENLVKLIVSVAASLDIRTVAEGVETRDQLDTVTRLGVDYAQGYLLGHPTRTPTLRNFDD